MFRALSLLTKRFSTGEMVGAKRRLAPALRPRVELLDERIVLSGSATAISAVSFGTLSPQNQPPTYLVGKSVELVATTAQGTLDLGRLKFNSVSAGFSGDFQGTFTENYQGSTVYVNHPNAAIPYTDVYTTAPESITINVSGYAGLPPVKPILVEGLGYSSPFIKISLSGSADFGITETHSYIEEGLDVHNESWVVDDPFSISFSGLIPRSGTLRLSGQVNVADQGNWWWAQDDDSVVDPWQVPFHKTGQSQIAPFGNLTLSQNITGSVANQPIA